MEFALRQELLRRGCTTTQVNSKIVEIIDEMLKEYTGADILQKYKDQVLNEISRVEGNFSRGMTSYQNQTTNAIQKAFNDLKFDVTARVGNIEVSTQLLESNLEKIDGADRVIKDYEFKISALSTKLRNLEEEYARIREDLKNFDEEINKIRRESVVENEDMKESLAFQRDALKNNIEAIRESGVEITPDLMSSVITASSYSTWRQLDPKNQQAYRSNYTESRKRSY